MPANLSARMEFPIDLVNSFRCVFVFLFAAVIFILQGCSGPLAGSIFNGANENLLLQLDQFFADRPRFNGVLQTYGANNASDANSRHDTYDNAVAAIYLARRNTADASKAILDSMATSMYGDGPLAGEQIQSGASASKTSSFRLLKASGNAASACDGEQCATDMGNNAFVGMAFAKYAAAQQDSCYALVSRDILAAIDTERNCATSPWKGWKRRLPAGGENDGRSTEHAIDIGALARMLGDADTRNNAATFIANTYDPDQQKYTAGAGDCSADQRSTWCNCRLTDTAVWNAAADGDKDNPDRLAAALKHTILEAGTTDVGPDGYTYSGVKFSSTGSGIQWEVTASTVIAFDHIINSDRYTGAIEEHGLRALYQEQVQSYRDSIKHMIQTFGFVWGSVLPDGSLTYQNGGEMGWTYYKTPALVATAWAGLMLLHSDGNGILDASANPYAFDDAVPALDENAKSCIPR